MILAKNPIISRSIDPKDRIDGVDGPYTENETKAEMVGVLYSSTADNDPLSCHWPF